MKHKVKVTVLDKKFYPELQQQYCDNPISGVCPCYNVGDEFIFYRDEESPAVFLGKTGFKTYINKLEKKFHTDNKYLSYINYSVSFRQALDLQVNQLCNAIENNEPELYRAVVIR